MAERIEITDKKRERFIKKGMEEMKKRYKTVNDKLWNLDTISRDQAESFRAIQSKLEKFYYRKLISSRENSETT